MPSRSAPRTPHLPVFVLMAALAALLILGEGLVNTAAAQDVPDNPYPMKAFKYHDVNGNGRRDAGENGLAGWEFCLYHDAARTNPVLDTNGNRICATSGADGYVVSARVVPAGSYYVCEETVLPGWTNTDPGTATRCKASPVPVLNNSQLPIFGNTTGGGAPTPGIEIVKLTNGADANDANGADVPLIAPGATVTWRYRVTNTGSVNFAQANVVVTDDVIGPVTTIVERLNGDTDAILEPGETWVYEATGTALNLQSLSPRPSYVVNGCDADGSGDPRPTYHNVGQVAGTPDTGPQVSDSDPSHYCNPPAPGIEIVKLTNGADANDPNGADVPVVAPGATVTWRYRVTNTGNVPFTEANVDVTDNVIGAVTTIVERLGGDADAMLEPGETWVYEATDTAPELAAISPRPSYVVDGCDADGSGDPRPTYFNVGEVVGTPTMGPQVSDDDPSHYCNPPEEPEPGIEIVKLTNGADANDPNGADVPLIAPGATVTWHYRVTNTGSVDFAEANVVVTDDVIGPVTTIVERLGGDTDAVLEPGETWVYEATGTAVDLPLEPGVPSYVVAGCNPEGNPAPGERGAYHNVGTVVGTPVEGPDVTDDDPSHYCNPPAPGIEIVKLTNGADANDADGADVPQIVPGDLVTWRYVVTNTGDIAFDEAEVVVTDDVIGPVTTIVERNGGDGDAFLEPGESWVYEATGAALELETVADGTAYIVEGCNPGNAVSPGPRDAYRNVGAVTVPGDSDDDPSHYCNPPRPAIEIIKYTNGADANDPNGADVPVIEPTLPISWTYLVTNVGTVAFDRTQVTVTDDVAGEVTEVIERVIGDDDDVLEPGEAWLFRKTGLALDLEIMPDDTPYILPEGCAATEPGPRETYHNVGTVVATPPTGEDVTDSDPSHYCNPPRTEPREPDIAIKKYTNGFDADLPDGPDVPLLLEGADVVWTYVVTNTGSLPLTDVTVTDDQGVAVTCPRDELFPGEFMTCEASGTATSTWPGVYANIGTVVGTPPAPEDDVTDSDPSHYKGYIPAHIGDYVFRDVNPNGIGPEIDAGDGLQNDPREVGMPGTEVRLYTCEDELVDTVFTDEDGLYGFDVVPGCYYVVFIKQPGGFFTTRPEGSPEDANSDCEPASSLPMPPGVSGPNTCRTRSFTAVPGTNDLTWDAGIGSTSLVNASAVGDFVWFESIRQDGIQQPTEPGVGNVCARLYRVGEGGDEELVAETCTSNEDEDRGFYLFNGLDAGTYVIEWDLPTGRTATTPNVGDDDSVDSDGVVNSARPRVARTAAFFLPINTVDLTWDLGLVNTSTDLDPGKEPGQEIKLFLPTLAR